MRYLYKYPQAEFPYRKLIEENRRRGREEFEYELLDTGVFDDDRYFDVFVEYAKAAPEDLLIRVSVVNRGPDAAQLDLLPTLWFRNLWSWHENSDRPILRELPAAGPLGVAAVDPALGERFLYVDGDASLLFTENETNTERIFGVPNRTPYVKDGINEHVVHGRTDLVNPKRRGSKAAALCRLSIGPGECRSYG